MDPGISTDEKNLGSLKLMAISLRLHTCNQRREIQSAHAPRHALSYHINCLQCPKSYDAILLLSWKEIIPRGWLITLYSYPLPADTSEIEMCHLNTYELRDMICNNARLRGHCRWMIMVCFVTNVGMETLMATDRYYTTMSLCNFALIVWEIDRSYMPRDIRYCISLH